MTPAFLELVDLASARLGASVVAANDEFFAPKENLIRGDPPRWREGEYTERGKWMDGWETRRRRDVGDDWCLIRLGAPGIARGVDVETTHFRGNYPEAFALEVCDLPGEASLDEVARAEFAEVLARTALAGDTHNFFAVERACRATYVRLRIFPDGGVARLRVFGDVLPDWTRLRRRGDVDLAAAEHGGMVVACSDMFFGSRHNLILPGDALSMGDGWETKRRRGPGHDWTIVKLGAAGDIRRIEVDTRHFKGNAPGTCSLEALAAKGLTDGITDGITSVDLAGAADWRELLPRVALRPDAQQTFEDEVRAIGAVTHVRLNIFPDGGVGRLRLFGRPQ
ncbi:MAG: allantoicase [Acidobacteriota bacterium]